jgi:hypothetical protein
MGLACVSLRLETDRFLVTMTRVLPIGSPWAWVPPSTHCRTTAHCRTLPHTAALGHTRTAALTYTTKQTAAHCCTHCCVHYCHTLPHALPHTAAPLDNRTLPHSLLDSRPLPHALPHTQAALRRTAACTARRTQPRVLPHTTAHYCTDGHPHTAMRTREQQDSLQSSKIL